MKFYKDVNMMGDVFELNNGEQYLLRWIVHAGMSQKEKSRLASRVNIRALLIKYGIKI
jgi:hypothetical protein